MFIFISDMDKLLPLALVEPAPEAPLLMELKCEETFVEEWMVGAAADWLVVFFMLASLKTLD